MSINVQPNRGCLYVVATPIGHLDDLSPRARAVLAEVALIAAEDTRHTGRMLARLGIRRPLLSLHEHNEAERSAELFARLEQGEDIALVSDAGTPLISDPGYPLVRAVRGAGLRVVPIPGPCALIAALSVSGLPTDRFVFEGFLPAKAAARRARLNALEGDPRTLIVYEAIHRLLPALEDMTAVFGGEREACLARELTKLHETVTSGCLSELLIRLEAQPQRQRGEVVLVVAGAKPGEQETDDSALDGLLAPLLAELPLKQAVRIAMRQSGRPRNAVYARALALREGGEEDAVSL
jgi:16S rRNA (cytidine1402-2'-O)-methyltransferase